MLPEVLTIIDLSVRLSLEIAADVPIEGRRTPWERWGRFFDVWWGLRDRVGAQVEAALAEACTS